MGHLKSNVIQLEISISEMKAEISEKKIIGISMLSMIK